VTKSFIKFLKYFLFITVTFVGLLIILLGSVWVAGPRLFTLDNHKNILFISSEIDSPRSQIYLAYFFPSTQEIKVVAVESSQVSVLGGYGDYELEKVLSLLTMERKKTNYKLAAMSWGTKTIIDSVANINPTTQLESKKQLQQQLWQAAFNNFANPAEFIELAKAFFFTKSIPSEQISFVSDPVLVDNLNVLDNVVLYEDCNVAVVNTTDKTGLASKISDMLEKNGAVVVRVTDQNSPYQLSTLSFNPDHGSCQLLSERLQVLFPDKITRQDHAQLQQEYRADLIIFIGKDLANLI